MGKLKLKAKKGVRKPKRTTVIKKKKHIAPPVDDFTEDTPSDEDSILNEEESDIESDDRPQHSDEDSKMSDEAELSDEVQDHKKALSKLKDTDPEFYDFLQENDKNLLQFDVSDDESEQEASADEEELSDEDVAQVSKVKDHGTVNLKMLDAWRNDIETDKGNKAVITAMQAFQAALNRLTPDGEQESSRFVVQDSAVFNGIVQLCVTHLGPALKRYLGIGEKSNQLPHKSKKFVKIKGPLKQYLLNLLQLHSGVSSANIQTVLLKHFHYMTSFIVSYPNITKLILKRLVGIWGSSDEHVRVLAFFCILRITNSNRVKYLDIVLKSMYMTYVKHSKFVSISSLACQNFMRRSLVEMYALDVNVSYEHVFLYVRQLAIHLRNAITSKKKENIQTVYNWQFVNSVRLWGNLLSETHNKQQMAQLVYPFVQVCLGTIKLLPTAQYYPLRFHLTQILIDLTQATDVFVPILPFLTDVLVSYNFNKKHQKMSAKPLNFTFILRASKSQMSENGFKDAIIDTIYEQMLQHLTAQSGNVYFPDLAFLTIVELKRFLKQSSHSNYNRKMKQLLDKIIQNRQFIENEAKKLTLNITDFKQIEGWEAQIRNKKTPLMEFYDSWIKVHSTKKAKLMSAEEEEVKEVEVTKKSKKRKRVEAVDDDDGDNVQNELIQHDEADIVEDFKLSDW